jgi:hypothetical protein
LPKGYAEPPYSSEEMRIFREVLSEHINESPDILDQGFLEAEPVKDLDETKEDFEDPEFDAKLDARLKTELGLNDDLAGQVISRYMALNKSEQANFRKEFRNHTISSFIKTGYKPFEKFFSIVPTAKAAGGMGRGEVQILLAVKDSETGGTGKHDIVMPGGEWEVKELTVNSYSMDPAKYGSAGSHDLTYMLQDFYEQVMEPFVEMGDPYEELKKVVDPSSHDAMKEIVNVLEEFFLKGIPIEKMRKAYEISHVPFENLYKGFQALNKLFFKSNLDVDVRDTRLSIKGDEKGTYWVDDGDAEKIRKAAGSEKAITINIGDPVDNENRNIIVWFKRFERFEFVKNPEALVTEMDKIKTGFFTGAVKGVIWYAAGETKPNLGLPSDFVTTNITRGNYRFRLKSKQNLSKFTLMAAQG